MSPIFLVLALLSEWIYTQNTTPPWGLTTMYMAARVAAFSNPDKSTCIVVFRGTDSIADLIDDLVTEAYQSCDGNFISGFTDSYRKLDMSAVKRSIKGCKDLYITGHSLGGAMAEIASNDLSTLVTNPTKVVTFGCPRVCCVNDEVTTGRVATTRMVNRHDPIPALPGRSGATHVAHCDGVSLELPSMKRHDDLNWPTLIGHEDPFDHEISRYVKALSDYINQRDY